MRTAFARLALAALVPAAAFLASCGGAEEEITDDINPFVQVDSEGEKADTAYVNPAGKEVEVDLEADVTTTALSSIRRAPAELGQFALTNLRKNGDFYLESLAENAGSLDRVEWKIGTEWKTARQVASASASTLKHFRIRGVNAVLLNSMATGVKVGKTFKAKIPTDPFNLVAAIGDSCVDDDDHITLSDDVYWYRWLPTAPGCRATTQDMVITVSKLLPKGNTVYPEYDKLIADGKITSVILFGQIGDGAISDSDPGMIAMNDAVRYLLGGGYKEVKPAPLGRRFSRKYSNITMEIDLYSPREFSGLGDYAHFANLQKGITEHEIVAYDGHSMLGASDFWSRPRYPSNYQIFLYGGCLGYEYYVRPIEEGKGGWANLDLMSAVVEVSANANRFAIPAIAKIGYAITHGYRVSWQQILSAVRTNVGDSTFGVSGVRDNKYCPAGASCGG